MQGPEALLDHYVGGGLDPGTASSQDEFPVLRVVLGSVVLHFLNYLVKGGGLVVSQVRNYGSDGAATVGQFRAVRGEHVEGLRAVAFVDRDGHPLGVALERPRGGQTNTIGRREGRLHAWQLA
ncbi:hypothetical protein D9M68_975800 [compost metagenome]